MEPRHSGARILGGQGLSSRAGSVSTGRAGGKGLLQVLLPSLPSVLALQMGGGCTATAFHRASTRTANRRKDSPAYGNFLTHSGSLSLI